MVASAPSFTASLPRKRMAAGVLFTDDADRVLLVEPTYKDSWEIPGGSVETDESPYAAAAREVAEELGIAVTPGRLLVVDWMPPRDDSTEGVMFVFDGGILDIAQTTRIVLAADELAQWAWCDADTAQQRLLPVLATRVAAALQARRHTVTTYLEFGVHVA